MLITDNEHQFKDNAVSFQQKKPPRHLQTEIYDNKAQTFLIGFVATSFYSPLEVSFGDKRYICGHFWFLKFCLNSLQKGDGTKGSGKHMTQLIFDVAVFKLNICTVLTCLRSDGKVLLQDKIFYYCLL